MRLYLVVAMLVLALAAFTQAQEAEATMEEKFAVFTNQMGEMGKKLADKAQITFEDIRSSEFIASSQTWLEQQMEKVKQKFTAIGQ